MSQKIRRKLFTPVRLFILFLVACVFVAGLWLALRAAIVNGMSTGIADVEQQGYQVGHGGLTVSGFPVSLNASTQNLTIAAPPGPNMDPSKNWSLKLADTMLTSGTVTPLSWRVRHRGDIGVDMRNLSGERLMFTIAPAQIDIDAAITVTGKLKLAQFDIGKTAINPILGQAPIISNFGSAHGDLRARGNTAVLTVNAYDAVLSDQAVGMLDKVLGTQVLEIALVMSIDNWAILQTSGAQAWQNAGGRLASDDWTVRWGKVDFVGDFDIGTKDGLPDGIVHVRIKDASGLVDSLLASGLVDNAYGPKARLLVSSLKVGGDGRSSLEFTIRKGVVKYGFIELYKFQ